MHSILYSIMNSVYARSDQAHTLSSGRGNRISVRLEWILFITLSLLLAAGFITLVVLASIEAAQIHP
jgi:hypothetical protein